MPEISRSYSPPRRSITAKKKKIACAPNALKKSAIEETPTARTRRSKTPTARTLRATGSRKQAATGRFLKIRLRQGQGRVRLRSFPQPAQRLRRSQLKV